jgi:hypothetical protein
MDGQTDDKPALDESELKGCSGNAILVVAIERRVKLLGRDRLREKLVTPEQACRELLCQSVSILSQNPLHKEVDRNTRCSQHRQGRLRWQ